LIYICVPTYNEARTVGVLLWKIRQVMAKFPRDYQVLLADDGSTDATPEVLAPYTRVLPLTIYRHETRRGYAASIEKLLREVVRLSDYPRRDIVVTLQADFTDEPEEIPALVRRIEGGADVVTGALSLRSGQAPRSIRWTHRLLRYLVRRGRWPEGVTDPLSGFRAYRVITLKKALAERNGGPLLEGQGWAANVELLRLVVPYARRVDEAPVEVRYDRRFRETRFRPWETVRGILSVLRMAPKGKAEEAAPAPDDSDWEELPAGSVLTDALERGGARRRGGRRGRGGTRSGRGVAKAGARRDGEVTEAEAVEVEVEVAEPKARGGQRRARSAAGGTEEAQGGGERRRRGGAARQQAVGEPASAEGDVAAVAGAPEVAGEGDSTAGEPAGEVRRRRRPRRRSGGGARAEGDAAGPTVAAADEAAVNGAAEGTSVEGGEGGERRGGGARRGRRRGGRRTGAGSQGTPVEEPSSGATPEV